MRTGHYCVLFQLKKFKFTGIYKSKTPMMLITSLSKYLIQNLISEWFTVDDLILFNSALVNQKCRKVILQNLEGCCMSNRSRVVTSNEYYWLRKQNLYVRKLYFDFSNHTINMKNVMTPVIKQDIYLSLIVGINVSDSDWNHVFSIFQYSQNLTEIKLIDTSKFLRTKNQRYELKQIVKLGPQLTSLTLRGPKVAGIKGLIKFASGCRQLTKLHIVNNEQILDKTVCELCHRLPQLVDIKLANNTKLTEKSFCCVINSFPQLQRLYLLNRWSLSGEQSSSNAELLTLGVKCPSLVEIRLVVSNHNNKDINSIVINVAQHCLLLTSLDLSGNSSLENDTLLSAAQHLKAMKHLNVNACVHIGRTAVEAVIRYCPALTGLHISKTSADILSLQQASGLTHVDIGQSRCLMHSELGPVMRRLGSTLTSLSIAGIFDMDDNSVRIVAKHCRRLRRFDMNFCGTNFYSSFCVSPKCIPYIAEYLSDLEWLNVSFCLFNLTDSLLLLLLEKCEYLTQIVGIVAESLNLKGPNRYIYADQQKDKISLQCEAEVRVKYPKFIFDTTNMPTSEELDE